MKPLPQPAAPTNFPRAAENIPQCKELMTKCPDAELGVPFEDNMDVLEAAKL